MMQVARTSRGSGDRGGARLSNEGRLVVVLLGLALLLRLAFIALWSPPAPQYDAAVYDAMARQILNGEGVHAHGMRALRPPLYPLFLAAVYAPLGPRVPLAQAVQVALSLVLLAALFLLTKRLFGGRAGLVALAIGAVHPQLVRYPSLLMSENLYLPLLIGALLVAAYARGARAWFCAGILLGLAALVRELALLVGLVLAAGLGAASLRPSPAQVRAQVRALAWWSGALVAGLAVAVAPWSVRNFLLLDAFVPITTNFGWVFWLGYNPHSDGFYHPFILPRGMTGEIAVSQYFMSTALEWIRQNPQDAVQLTLYRAWLFWRPFFVASQEDGRLGMLFALAKSAAVLVTFGGAALAWNRWRDTRVLPIVVLCLVSTVAHAATHMEVGGRYRLPVEVALIPLAGAGLWGLIQALPRREWGTSWGGPSGTPAAAPSRT